MVDVFVEDFTVNDEEIVRTVDQLIKKFKEFNHLNTERILVLVNNKKAAKEEKLEKGEGTYAVMSSISQKTSLIVSHFADHYYSNILEIITSEFNALDSNAQKIVLYFELRKIDPEYNMRKTGPNDWIKIIHGVGKNYKKPDESSPDILDEDFSWENCLGSYYSQLEND